ncbi:MAG: hypothetical protein OXH01_00310 [Bacteroidetes bacterium]|nr:hypothetical protein [Bacteroidota bacterium]
MYRLLFLGLLIAPISLADCIAQSGFGGMNQLSEKLVEQRWQTHRQLDVMGGVSLIGAQWRGLALLNLEAANYPFALRLRGSARQGPLGRYAPDWDEAYDFLRLIQFARVQADNHYARIGPIRDMRHGIGHVVNHFSSSASWDARTIGAELAWARGIFEFSGFTADVLFNNLVGARVSLDLPYTSELGINYANHHPTNLTAWSIDLQSELFETGRIAFAPYVSYAWYTRYGDGLAFGADVRSLGFLDILSFRIRVGAFYNSRHFIPGYIGTLFSVNNSQNRIIRSGADLQRIASGDFAGLLLQEARGVNDLLTEFELQIRDTFWIAYSWRRHYGAQRLSELYFRLFMKAGDYFNLEVGVDRLGERTFADVFTAFSEQSALIFATDLRIRGSIFLRTEARYTFEPIDPVPHYLVQRRFEPTLGIRVSF